jgi:hypothetical protein
VETLMCTGLRLDQKIGGTRVPALMHAFQRKLRVTLLGTACCCSAIQSSVRRFRSLRTLAGTGKHPWDPDLVDSILSQEWNDKTRRQGSLLDCSRTPVPLRLDLYPGPGLWRLDHIWRAGSGHGVQHTPTLDALQVLSRSGNLELAIMSCGCGRYVNLHTYIRPYLTAIFFAWIRHSGERAPCGLFWLECWCVELRVFRRWATRLAVQCDTHAHERRAPLPMMNRGGVDLEQWSRCWCTTRWL